jgi:hypothetical protein
MTRIYIAGPMRGHEDLNYPAFNEAAEDLKAVGWEVSNPAEINPDTTTPYAECMRSDLAALVECEAIYMLKGWGESKGATLEYQIAEALEMDIYYQDVDYSEEEET